ADQLNLARKPASTGRVTPVTYLDSSEASQATAWEMSTGSIHGIGNRFMAVNVSPKSATVGFSTPGANALQIASFWIILVLVELGCTELTRMKCGASSLASDRIKPTTACLPML